MNDVYYADTKNDVVVSRMGFVYDGTCTLLRLRSGKRPVEMAFIMEPRTTVDDYRETIKSHIKKHNLPFNVRHFTI